MAKKISLEDFVKGKRNYMIDVVNECIVWKKNSYRIVDDNGKLFVVYRELKPLSEIKEDVLTLNKHLVKKEIKFNTYKVFRDEYLITGIGGVAFKVSKNGRDEDWVRYMTIEGQELLEKIMEVEKDLIDSILDSSLEEAQTIIQ